MMFAWRKFHQPSTVNYTFCFSVVRRPWSAVSQTQYYFRKFTPHNITAIYAVYANTAIYAAQKDAPTHRGT